MEGTSVEGALVEGGSVEGSQVERIQVESTMGAAGDFVRRRAVALLRAVQASFRMFGELLVSKKFNPA